MKILRNTLILPCLLLCAIWATAQAYPSQSSSQPSSQTSNGETTVQGCLNSSDGNYTLTDSSGTAYQLTGDTSKLSEHVGHKVEIKGTTSSSSTNPGSSSANPGSGTSTKPTLNVTSMKHISKTCP